MQALTCPTLCTLCSWPHLIQCLRVPVFKAATRQACAYKVGRDRRVGVSGFQLCSSKFNTLFFEHHYTIMHVHDSIQYSMFDEGVSFLEVGCDEPGRACE
jgi:hypothetical protein